LNGRKKKKTILTAARLLGNAMFFFVPSHRPREKGGEKEKGGTKLHRKKKGKRGVPGLRCRGKKWWARDPASSRKGKKEKRTDPEIRVPGIREEGEKKGVHQRPLSKDKFFSPKTPRKREKRGRKGKSKREYTKGEGERRRNSVRCVILVKRRP